MVYANLTTVSTYLVTPVMKGQAQKVWRGMRTKTRRFSSLFFSVEHSLFYFLMCHAIYRIIYPLFVSFPVHVPFDVEQ